MKREPVSSLLRAFPSEHPSPDEGGQRGQANGVVDRVRGVVHAEARLMLATLTRLAFGPSVRGIVTERSRAARRTRSRSGPRRSRREPPVESVADEEAELERVFSHPDPSVRARALDVVTTFSAERAERYIALLMWDSDANVRRAATAACARLTTPRMLSSLILALDDPEPAVRQSAATALETVTGRTLPDALAHDDARRESVIRELKQWWRQERYSDLSERVRGKR